MNQLSHKPQLLRHANGFILYQYSVVGMYLSVFIYCFTYFLLNVGSSVRTKRQRVSKSLTNSVPSMKHSLTNYCRNRVNECIFQGIEFLLTGLSSEKERDMEALIRSSGGVVLYDIPSQNSRGKRHSTLSHFPIVLCMRKVCVQ